MPGTLFPALMFETLDPLELPDDVDVAAHTVFRLGSPPLELAYPLDQAVALRPILDILTSRLHAIGLDASAVAVTADAVAAYAANPSTAPDMYLALATPAAAHPVLLARGYFASDAPGNVFGLILPTADRLIAQAETQAARVASDKAFIILSRKLTDMQGFIPIAEMRSVVVHRAGLASIVARPSFPLGAFDYALATETP